MKRLSAIVSVFAILWATVLPAFAGENAAATGAAPASSASSANNSSDPLLRVLVSKGIISAEEARFLSAGTPGAQRDKLVLLLREKGLLTASEADELRPANVATPQAVLITAQSTSVVTPQSKPAEPAKPAAPKVIAAVAPLRVLQLDPPKKDGLIPDIKLGTGARVKLYGMIKASSIYDSSSPYGTDMPIPGFIGVSATAAKPGDFDAGPGTANEFHLKARFLRVGSNFEWPDIADKWTLTGKLEFDFEGNFTRVLNRNISTIRSSQASIRLAWGRMDYKASDKNSFFALFGQDWTPFGSSTLPNLVETTGLGLGFGTLYERAPQMRFGMTHQLGGSRKWSLTPEFAIVMPAYGNDPKVVDDQLGYGERQGADSARPEVQGRLVTQWQLDKAPSVAPAQFIVSFVQGSRKVIVRKDDVPLCNPLVAATAACPISTVYQTAFPHGAEFSTSRWGMTGEIQLPTRWVTVVAKYWRGADLRFYFVGGLLSNYNDLAGLRTASGVTAPSIDGSSTVIFALNAAGVPVMAPQKPVRSQGGFVNVGFPLGRIFKANPAGRNAGWQLYLHYALDEANARDARKTVASIDATTFALLPFGNQRNKNDLAASTLLWKFNNFLTFGLEESLYRTRMAGGTTAWGAPTGWPTFAGTPARSWHDFRSEFSTTFTF